MSCNIFRTDNRLFFASKLSVLETLCKLSDQILPRDVSLCFADFFWVNLQRLREEAM